MPNLSGIDTTTRSRRTVRVVLLLLAGCGLVGGALLLLYVPPTEDSFYPRCQFHSLTGLHCPGCGTTRALHALLNGRVVQAVAYNPLAPVVMPVLGWSLVRSLAGWGRGRPVAPESRLRKVSVWLLIVALVAFAVLRNIPAYPFTLLAPHEI